MRLLVLTFVTFVWSLVQVAHAARAETEFEIKLEATVHDSTPLAQSYENNYFGSQMQVRSDAYLSNEICGAARPPPSNLGCSSGLSSEHRVGVA